MSAFSINGNEFSGNADQLLSWAQSRALNCPPWEQDHLSFLILWFSGAHRFVFHTSGSTGVPSEVMFTRTQLEASARMTAQAFSCGRGTRAILPLPSSFVAGKMMLARTVINGWNLTWVEPASDPFHGQQPEADFIPLTPMQLSVMWEINPHILDRIKIVLVGGAALNLALEKKLQGCPARIVATYGMTETLTHVAIREVNGPHRSEFFYPLPGVKLNSGEHGELSIQAVHLGSDTVVTTDAVEWNDRGGFRVLGRLDNVINTGGVKVFPEKIEQQLAAGIQRPTYVTHRFDEVLGQKVVLCIEGQPLSEEEETMIETLVQAMPDAFERPREWIVIPCFERTSAGKIIRKTVNS